MSTSFRVYVGVRNEDGELIVTVTRQDGSAPETETAPLDPRYDLRNHSPTGFECGYEGSGPAQLALAILADHFGDDLRAVTYYQAFKREVIAKLPPASACDAPGVTWSFASTDVARAVAGLEDENPQLVERWKAMRNEPEELWREPEEL